MRVVDLQEICEFGQQALVETDYLRAERILAQAEQLAWEQRDYDSLSRLYMPLQEARRQIRQRCGEGEVCMDLLAQSASDVLDARHVVQNHPFGQLLVAGWGSIEPAIGVRRLAREHELYLETFLAAVYPTDIGRVVAIVPLQSDCVPPADARSIEELRRILPEHSLIFPESELPHGSRRGTAETFSQVMAMWERLHAPFLAEADAQADAIARMQGYRRVIDVDDACELAHQELAEVAKGAR